MIIPDNKKIMTILLSKRGAKGEPKSETSGMQPESSRLDPENAGTQSAAEDLVSAVHEKSPHKVVDALKSFLHHHKSSETEKK